LEDQGLAVNTERVRTASLGTVLTYQAAAQLSFTIRLRGLA